MGFIGNDSIKKKNDKIKMSTGKGTFFPFKPNRQFRPFNRLVSQKN
jgi:hypothetical protein